MPPRGRGGRTAGQRRPVATAAAVASLLLLLLIVAVPANAAAPELRDMRCPYILAGESPWLGADGGNASGSSGLLARPAAANTTTNTNTTSHVDAFMSAGPLRRLSLAFDRDGLRCLSGLEAAYAPVAEASATGTAASDAAMLRRAAGANVTSSSSIASVLELRPGERVVRVVAKVLNAQKEEKAAGGEGNKAPSSSSSSSSSAPCLQHLRLETSEGRALEGGWRDSPAPEQVIQPLGAGTSDDETSSSSAQPVVLAALAVSVPAAPGRPRISGLQLLWARASCERITSRSTAASSGSQLQELEMLAARAARVGGAGGDGASSSSISSSNAATTSPVLAGAKSAAAPSLPRCGLQLPSMCSTPAMVAAAKAAAGSTNPAAANQTTTTATCAAGAANGPFASSPTCLGGCCVSATGKCPSGTCALAGLGAEARFAEAGEGGGPTTDNAFCWGLGAPGTASGAGPCAGLACRLLVPGCASVAATDAGGACVGVVVEAPAAAAAGGASSSSNSWRLGSGSGTASLSPLFGGGGGLGASSPPALSAAAKSMLGLPCLEAGPGAPPLTAEGRPGAVAVMLESEAGDEQQQQPTPADRQLGQYVARLWAPCDCSTPLPSARVDQATFAPAGTPGSAAAALARVAKDAADEAERLAAADSGGSDAAAAAAKPGLLCKRGEDGKYPSGVFCGLGSALARGQAALPRLPDLWMGSSGSNSSSSNSNSNSSDWFGAGGTTTTGSSNNANHGPLIRERVVSGANPDKPERDFTSSGQPLMPPPQQLQSALLQRLEANERKDEEAGAAEARAQAASAASGLLAATAVGEGLLASPSSSTGSSSSSTFKSIEPSARARSGLIMEGLDLQSASAGDLVAALRRQQEQQQPMQMQQQPLLEDEEASGVDNNALLRCPVDARCAAECGGRCAGACCLSEPLSSAAAAATSSAAATSPAFRLFVPGPAGRGRCVRGAGSCSSAGLGPMRQLCGGGEQQRQQQPLDVGVAGGRQGGGSGVVVADAQSTDTGCPATLRCKLASPGCRTGDGAQGACVGTVVDVEDDDTGGGGPQGASHSDGSGSSSSSPSAEQRDALVGRACLDVGSGNGGADDDSYHQYVRGQFAVCSSEC